MEFKKGQDRTAPLSLESMESFIAQDNVVRVIDLFVENLDFQELGFLTPKSSKMGASAYHPSVLLKLYIYGYLNGIHSSRKLEKTAAINIELMWLLNKLVPDHNTISNFRRDSGESIKKTFKEAVKLGIKFNLVGKTMIAGDGTTLRGQNSKKNNFNEKKIERQENYIEKKITQYLAEMEEVEKSEDEEKKSLDNKT